MNAEVHQFAGLLDALACGAALIEPTGRIVHVNPRALAMMNKEREQVVGQNVLDLYPDGDAAGFVQSALSDLAHAREGEFFVPRADGSKLPVVMSGRSWRADRGGKVYYAVTMTDVSPLKEAEDSWKTQYRIIAELSNTILSQAENLKDYSELLEDRVRERTVEIHEANMDAIYMLAIASESKDQDTGLHVRRLQHYTHAIAREMGFDAIESERIAYAAILHDIGKIHVPDHILKKPGPLTPDERRQIEGHTVAGERILSTRPFFDSARKIARSHHENFDGSGYPDQADGAAIPIEARIVHLADVYDALTTPRVYKSAWESYDAALVIEESAGKMFDPDVVKAFDSLKSRGDLQRLADKVSGNGAH